LLALLALGCGDPERPAPSVGTNSNWLRACASDDQCGGDLPACECGACTVTCNADDDCGELAEARCALGVDPAAWAECESRDPAISGGICLPRCEPGSCGAEQACVAGACVLAPLPDAALCAELGDWDAARRTFEEELLALVQAARMSGGVSCGSAAPSAPAPPMRFDTRVVCAARAWALDIEQTGMPGLTDSAGRTGLERLLAAGHPARLWGDSYAVQTATAAQALDRMFSDAGSCSRMLDARYTDVGVGQVGQTFVVSIAAE
jgi:hypothetical protein